MVPYARVESVDGKYYAVCPRCGVHVLLVEMKDHESFTMSEYARHYVNYHGRS